MIGEALVFLWLLSGCRGLRLLMLLMLLEGLMWQIPVLGETGEASLSRDTSTEDVQLSN